MKIFQFISFIFCARLAGSSIKSKLTSILKYRIMKGESTKQIHTRLNTPSVIKESKQISFNTIATVAQAKRFLNDSTIDKVTFSLTNSESEAYDKFCQKIVDEVIFTPHDSVSHYVSVLLNDIALKLAVEDSKLSKQTKIITTCLNWKITNKDLSNYFLKMAKVINLNLSISQNIQNVSETIKSFEKEYSQKFCEENMFVPVLNLIVGLINYEKSSETSNMFTIYILNPEFQL